MVTSAQIEKARLKLLNMGAIGTATSLIAAYVPIPIIAGLSRAEIGVGASAWAYGSQMWRPNTALLVKNPINIAKAINPAFGCPTTPDRADISKLPVIQ